jgi:hypothetical protein
MGERSVFRVLVGKLEEENNLGGPGENVRIIFRCIFGKWDMGNGMRRAGSG